MPAKSSARERAGYPPFGRLASLIVSAGDRPTAEGFARKLAAIAPIDERIQVLGPAEAPLAVIKGRYRFRLLVKSLRNGRSVGISARMAGGRSQDQGQSQARGRRRSAELFVIELDSVVTPVAMVPGRHLGLAMSKCFPGLPRSCSVRLYRRCSWRGFPPSIMILLPVFVVTLGHAIVLGLPVALVDRAKQ